MDYRQTGRLVQARWLRTNELNPSLSHRVLVFTEKLLWLSETSIFSSACTHGCPQDSPETCFWLLWAGATFRCKGYIESCFPNFHFCHKQSCTVIRGCTFCYEMVLFLFYGLHYWGKGLRKRCAYRSFGIRCCQTWEWSDLYYQTVPWPHKLLAKIL